MKIAVVLYNENSIVDESSSPADARVKHVELKRFLAQRMELDTLV